MGFLSDCQLIEQEKAILTWKYIPFSPEYFLISYLSSSILPPSFRTSLLPYPLSLASSFLPLFLPLFFPSPDIACLLCGSHCSECQLSTFILTLRHTEGALQPSVPGHAFLVCASYSSLPTTGRSLRSCAGSQSCLNAPPSNSKRKLQAFRHGHRQTLKMRQNGGEPQISACWLT